MSVYVCDYCNEPHRSAITASLCCDIVSMESDLDLDGSEIIRGVN